MPVPPTALLGGFVAIFSDSSGRLLLLQRPILHLKSRFKINDGLEPCRLAEILKRNHDVVVAGAIGVCDINGKTILYHVQNMVDTLSVTPDLDRFDTGLFSENRKSVGIPLTNRFTVVCGDLAVTLLTL